MDPAEYDHGISEQNARQKKDRYLPEPDQARQVPGRLPGFRPRKDKTPTAFAIGVSEFNLDDDLLSHGETPHYHRR
ncbi:hypothetical protein, partial [Pseudomonas sp. B6(2017)]|uniref:hypothetical protein n=1 Tax=Pseudomonas sp. B6(2017) TaxID=1981713 RepID=UPI001C43C1BE